MERDRTKSLIRRMVAAYPKNHWNKETVSVYVEMIEDLDYGEVKQRLDSHIKNNRFVPSISELRGAHEREYKTAAEILKEREDPNA